MNSHRSRSPLSVAGLSALAGSTLGVIEASVVLGSDVARASSEIVLVLALGALGYAVPAFTLAFFFSHLAARSRFGSRAAPIGGALIALWLFVAVVSLLALHQVWRDLILAKALASVALATLSCGLLKLLWPVGIERTAIWTGGSLLTIAAAAGFFGTTRLPLGPRSVALTGVFIVAGFGLTVALGAARSRPATLIMLVIGAALFASATYWQGNPEKGRKKNVLLITVDTLRADRVGAYGYPGARTPTMDSWAAKGTLFERALSPTPTTCPSHLSIMTGLDPSAHGVLYNRPELRAAGSLSLPEHFARAGYTTAGFVSGLPLQRGNCDVVHGFATYGDDLSPWAWLPQTAARISPIHLAGVVLPNARKRWLRNARSAAKTTEDALSWLDQYGDRPFFLWVHYYDPHLPYSPPPATRDLRMPAAQPNVDGDWYGLSPQRKAEITADPVAMATMHALYDAEVAYVDRELSRLEEALARRGVIDNTVIVLTSDHGETHGEHHRFFIRDMYSTSLGVPLIVRDPTLTAQRKRVASRVRLKDVAPTLLELTGQTVETERRVGAGRSLVPLLRGDESAGDRTAFAVLPKGKNPRDMYAVEAGDYKLIWTSDDRDVAQPAQLQEPEHEQLFRVSKDPEEERNLLDFNPPELSNLRDELADWRQRVRGAPRELSTDLAERLRALGYVN